MPQRFLRPQITNSDRWNSVSFAAQSLFIRLLTLVDDYGRYDGRASVIWAHCFAIYNDKNPQSAISLQQTEQLLQELAASRLIDLYKLQDKQIMQIEQWKERLRANVVEKWPSNPQNPQNIGVFEKSTEVAATSCTILPSSSSPSSSSSPEDDKASDKGSDQVSKKLTTVHQSLARHVERLLGSQWVNDAGKWIQRIKSQFSKTQRVFAEVEAAQKEGRITATPAQYAEQMWKEFKK